MHTANSIQAQLLGIACFPGAETSSESLMGLALEDTDQLPDGRLVT